MYVFGTQCRLRKNKDIIVELEQRQFKNESYNMKSFSADLKIRNINKKTSWQIVSKQLFVGKFWLDIVWSAMTTISLVFTARAYARAVLGVVILSVCLSVTRVDCDKTKWRTADIFIPHERAITLLLWYQEWLVGDAPFPLKSAFKVNPLRKMPTSTDFRS